MPESTNRWLYSSSRSGGFYSSHPSQRTAYNLAGQSGTQRMYGELRIQFHWPPIAAEEFNYVVECNSCGRYCCSKKHQRWMLLFSRSSPLEFVAIDSLGQLTKTRQANRLVIVMANRCRKLTRALQVAKSTALVVATAFLDHRIVPSEVPNTILTVNGHQVTSLGPIVL